MEQQGVHRSILDPIRRLHQQRKDVEGRQQEEHQHRLTIFRAFDVNRQSVQYLADFLSGDSHEVTELELWNLDLMQDGGLDVLHGLFANNTTLTKVALTSCNFGGTEEASQLLAAFQGNRLITDLTIYGISNLEGTALGICISGVLQNMPKLQRLKLGPSLDVAVIRAFQPGLRTNRHLKILVLSGCKIRDEGLRHIVDALVGNTTMEILDLSCNRITLNGLDDITRLLESTQLKEIRVGGNNDVFNDEAATQRFAHVLSRNGMAVQRLFISLGFAAAKTIFRALESNTVLEEMRMGHFSFPFEQGISQLIESLPRMKGLKRLHLDAQDLKLCLQKHASLIPALDQNTSLEELLRLDSAPWRHSPQYKAAVIAVKNLLARNRDMRRADLLLALQPRTNMPIASKSGIWCMALAKFAVHGLNHDEVQRDDEEDEEDNNNVNCNNNNGPVASAYPGASAIFKILQKRPTIVGKQVQRPAASTASQPPPPDNTNTKGHGSTGKSLETEPARKRRRL